MQSELTCTHFFSLFCLAKFMFVGIKIVFFPFCFDSWQRLLKDENFWYFEPFVCLLTV